jgi:hypothetical protein
MKGSRLTISDPCHFIVTMRLFISGTIIPCSSLRAGSESKVHPLLPVISTRTWYALRLITRTYSSLWARSHSYQSTSYIACTLVDGLSLPPCRCKDSRYRTRTYVEDDTDPKKSGQGPRGQAGVLPVHSWDPDLAGPVARLANPKGPRPLLARSWCTSKCGSSRENC